MGIVTAIVVYFVIWWTVLFVVLPLGIRSQVDDDEVILGTVPSAPVTPRLLRKMLQTTLLAAIVFAAYYVATQVYGIGPDSFPRIVPGT